MGKMHIMANKKPGIKINRNTKGSGLTSQLRRRVKQIDIPASIKGLIFDCDGTLVDSMPQHMSAWETAILETGSPFHLDFLLQARGMEEKEIIRHYNLNFNTSMDIEIVVSRKHEIFSDEIPHVKPIKPVVNVVLKHKDKLPMAVVSGGSEQNVLAELEVIKIRDFFDVVLTADDPIPPKPAPDLFIEAARMLGIPIKDCLVFEDGDHGISAATKAGMHTMDVRHLSSL